MEIKKFYVFFSCENSTSKDLEQKSMTIKYFIRSAGQLHLKKIFPCFGFFLRELIGGRLFRGSLDFIFCVAIGSINSIHLSWILSKKAIQNRQFSKLHDLYQTIQKKVKIGIITNPDIVEK